jgi:hypothetical protein
MSAAGLYRALGWDGYRVLDSWYSETDGRVRVLVEAPRHALRCRACGWADPSDSKIQELLECTDRATEFARKLRNKRIAHHDFPDPYGNVVPLPSREQIQEAIDSIRKVISTFEQKHDIPPTCYDFVLPRWSGVDALKAVLRKGCDH